MIPERNKTMQKMNSTPWYDVTSNWTSRWHYMLVPWGSARPKIWNAQKTKFSRPLSGSWRWWRGDRLLLWCPDTAPPTWCCRNLKNKSGLNPNVAKRCRIKSHKITCVNKGIPGQHSCHVGERQGLKWDTNTDKFLNNLNLEITEVIHQQYTSKWHVSLTKLEKQYLQRWRAWLDSMETVSCKKSTFSFISHTHLILPKLRGP